MSSKPPLNHSTSQDVWLKADPKAKSDAQEYLIYMLPGNPSIMTYYVPFLTTLSNSLAKSGISAHVGGYTPPGFSLTTNTHICSKRLPASLAEQVEYAEELIKVALAERVGDKKAKVILVAHSAGTYMILQILKRRAEKTSTLTNANIIGGILLCPAITHLAESKAGKAMTKVTRIPSFPSIAAAVAAIITCLIPLSTLAWIIHHAARQPSHTALAAAQLFKTPTAVRQMLYLTREELAVIREDVWGEEVWGSPGKRSVVRFLWVENDVWVNPTLRDELIAKRGRREGEDEVWKPLMEIDSGNGLVHGFIENVEQSEFVGEKVADMIRKMMRENGK